MQHVNSVCKKHKYFVAYEDCSSASYEETPGCIIVTAA